MKIPLVVILMLSPLALLVATPSRGDAGTKSPSSKGFAWIILAGQAESGQSFSEAEQQGVRRFWEELAARTAPQEDDSERLVLGQRLLRGAPTLSESAEVLALVRKAHLAHFRFGLPPDSDPAALATTAEELLAELAAEARDRDPATTWPGLYRAAARRSGFPLLGPSVDLPVTRKYWGYWQEISQLTESAELMEEWNGPTPAGRGPSLDLPPALAAAKSWPGWNQLESAARSGDTLGMLRGLNELSLALRAEALGRDPESLPPLPPALQQILVAKNAQR